MESTTLHLLKKINERKEDQKKKKGRREERKNGRKEERKIGK